MLLKQINIFPSYLICFKYEPKAKIDGTQIPTKIPSNWLPVNHKVTENKKEIKAKMIG